MPTVKIGASRQVVIPKKIHDQLGLAPGDYLEVDIQQGKVVFTPKRLVDKHLEEGLKDYETGRFIGPFDTVESAVQALRRAAESR